MHRGLRLIVFGLALSIACLPLGVSQAHPGDTLPARAAVLGYYVPYDSASWASLAAHADDLDVVAGQWVTIDACGGLSSHDDQTLKAFVQAHGLALEPSLYTISAWLDHRLLTDDETRAATIQNIVSYTVDEGYAGFDLDLEGVDPGDRDALTEFVATLGGALHDQGKLFSLALPAKERDTTTGWAGAFDYATLGGPPDLVTIMAYEYRGPFSGPGSVAPIDWVSRVAAYAAQTIPPNKVLLGLAFYGYDWNTSTGRTTSLGYPRAMAAAQAVQAVPTFDTGQESLTFGYASDADYRLPAEPPQTRLDHTITARAAPACDLKPPPTPPATPPPRPAPAPGEPQSHEVWIEDSASAAARVGVADANHLAGVSGWRLGLEDPNVWALLDGWRQAAPRV